MPTAAGHTVLDFIALLKKKPWMPIKILAAEMGTHDKQIHKWIRLTEVKSKYGPDPITGRNGVKLYAISLPKEKKACLELSKK